jgi:hypothetical protein
MEKTDEIKTDLPSLDAVDHRFGDLEEEQAQWQVLPQG